MVLEGVTMIKTISNCFFNNETGIIIDNAYDIYTLDCFIKYCEKNNILFLQSQDNDLNYLGLEYSFYVILNLLLT